MINIETSDRGKESFHDVCNFIVFKWNLKILQDFIVLVEKALNRLNTNPNIGTIFSKTIRKIVLHKNASLYYEYDENLKTITILLFIDNRQNPDAYFKLL